MHMREIYFLSLTSMSIHWIDDGLLLSFQAKALADKNQRDLDTQYEQEERHVSFIYAT